MVFKRIDLVDHSGTPWEWLSLSIVSPPALIPILDTGPLDAGLYEVKLWSTASATNLQTPFLFQHRDGADSTTLHQQVIVNGSFPFYFHITKLRLGANERFRIVPLGSTADTYTFGLFYRRLNYDI